MNSAVEKQPDPAKRLIGVADELQRQFTALLGQEEFAALISASDVEGIEAAANRLVHLVASAVAVAESTAQLADSEADLVEEPLAITSVLLVEDNTVNRMVAEGMLRQFHCSVEIARDGAEAVRQFRESDYDLIFMDCQMPVMDGFEAVGRIREIENERGGAATHIPIVALTANALKGDRDKCVAAGMNDYVSKPFSVADLQGALDRQLGTEKTSQMRALREADIVRLRNRPSSDQIQSDDAVIDDSVLNAIKKLTRTNGDQLLHKVVAVFLKTSPQLFDKLTNALLQADNNNIATAAHAFRSCCGSVGAKRLGRLCQNIEDHGNRGEIVGTDDWQLQLENRYEEVKTELQNRVLGAQE